MIKLKNPSQIDKMRSAGHMLFDVLCQLREKVVPGIDTKSIDIIAHELIVKNRAIPSFLNYNGFPATICASLEDEVVHGFPSKNTILKEGEILSIDCGLILEGWQADSAITVPVGKISDEKAQLIRETEISFWKGVEQAIEGNHVGDIGHAVSLHAEAFGYGVIRDCTGHGIGRELHEDPTVPNWGEKGHGTRLRAGMTIAVEPMIAMGTWRVHTLADDWTVVTNDHKPCSHYEHTIAIQKNGLPEILTLPSGYKWGLQP